MNQPQDKLPVCFGQTFDRNAPECMGGHDPAYTDDDGRHVRPPCDVASSCSIRAQASRQTTPTQVIPPANLVRPPTAFTQPSSPAQMYRPHFQQGYPQHVATVAPVAAPHYPPGAPQMMPMNSYMPQYLTAREPVNGQGLPKRLGLEMLRSIGKSLGHTIAHFCDVEIFGKRNE